MSSRFATDPVGPRRTPPRSRPPRAGDPRPLRDPTAAAAPPESSLPDETGAHGAWRKGMGVEPT